MVAPLNFTVDPNALISATNFHTIQDAVNAASSGTTITVAAGEYTENVTISTSGITIQGANAGIAHDGSRGLETQISGYILVTGDDTTLEGLTVADGGTVWGENAGIMLDADGLTVANTVFDGDGLTHRAIVTAANSTTDLTVSGSSFEGWQSGIYVNPGVSDLSVTDNSFTGNGNAMIIDGPGVTGDVSGNTFANSSGSHIGMGSWVPGTIDASILIGANTFVGSSSATSIYGTAGDDTLIGTSDTNRIYGEDGNDVIHADGIDTVTGGGGTDMLIVADGTDPADVVANSANFTGLELIKVDGVGADTFIVLDGMSIQAAIDAAANGDTILVAPGSYSTSANYNPTTNTNDPVFTNPVGLLVNKSLTIAGVDANGGLITDAGNVAATVTSLVQSNWGTNFFVTASDVTITGLSFLATSPGGEVNKAFEVVEDNFTLGYCVVGSLSGDVASTIYINDDNASANPSFVSDIESFLIHDNILRGDFVLANGAGFGHATTSMVLQDNSFIRNPGSSPDYNWGVIITGKDDAVAWRVQSVGPLVATGNSFSAHYTTERLLYMRDDDPARLPSNTFVQDFIADNGIAVFSYAVGPLGQPSVVPIGTTLGFVLAMSAGNASAYANAGDTLIVQTDGAPATETIVTDDLSIDLRSSGLDFEMDGGVITLTLQGSEDSNITGNAADNTITGNDGSNTIGAGGGADIVDAGGGDDMLIADAGNDVMDGGAGVDLLDMVNAGAGGSFVDLLTGTAFSSATGIDSVLNVEDVSGSAGADGLFGNAGANTFYATAGADIIDGRGGSDTFFAANTGSATTVNLSNGSVTGGYTATLTSIENVATGNGADVVTGSAADNVIQTGGGGDRIVASGGADTVDGGAGMDTMAFGGARADYTITWNGTTAVVTRTATGATTTVTDVGDLEFSDSHVLLVANGSSEFSTIQQAIDHGGQEILIADGTYAEDLSITDASVSLIAAGAGVTLAGQISVTGVMGAGDTVRFEGLNIDATGKTYGITVRTSANDITGVNDGSIQIIGGSISNAKELGLFYANPANGSSPTNPNTIGTFVIDGVAFSANGQMYTGARGQGHVNLFGFNGNLTVTDPTFTGPATSLGDAGFRGGSVTTPGAAVNPDKAITVTGIRTGTPGVGGYVDAGTLTIDNVQITGHYGSDVMSFYTIQSFAGIAIAGLDIDASARWTLVNFDSVSGTIDLSSGFTGTNAFPGAQISQLQGLSTNDALTGTDGYDILNGRGGADDMSGGDGSDLFVYASAAEFASGEQVDGGDGTDTVYFAASSAQTLTLTADVTNIETVLLNAGTVAMSVDASAVGNALGFTGNAAANAFTGTAFADSVAAGGGNDTVTGGGGNDSVDGGSGTDTVVVTGTATFAASGGTWSVTTGSGGTDSLQNVEIVDDGASGKVILVGQGGVASIQDALALAADGDTILIGEGTYSGNFTITQANLTIKGVGDPANIVIQGTFETDNGITGSVAEFFETAPSYNTAAGTGITIAASGVVLENVTVDSFHYGINLGNGIANVTIRDVDITDSEVGIRKGTAAAVTNLTIEGGSITDSYQGISVFKAVGAGRVSGLTIDGVTFDGIGEKGIYLETGDNVTIQNIVMNDVGQFGRGPAFGAAAQVGEFGNGIDINLKYDDGTPYSGILISDFTFNDVGLSAGVDSVPQDFGGAISIKARNDAGSYNTNPAYYTGTLVIQNGTIVGTSTAIRAGEPGKNIASPAISVSDVTVSGATVGELDNVTGSLATVVMTSASEVWRTVSTATGQVNISGGAGADTIYGGMNGDTLVGGNANDVLEGGAGADILNGNNGRDTAAYTQSNAAVSVDLQNGTATGGHAQGDVLALIENLIGSDHADTLDGSGAANSLYGGGGHDLINARAGNDDLQGGNGNDTINGGDGIDVMRGGAGADSLNGGANADTADYSDSDAGVTVTAGTSFGSGGHAQGDWLGSIENLRGSDGFGDVLNGNGAINKLEGLGGNDTIVAGGGDDILNGGLGADSLSTGNGYDTVAYDGSSQAGDVITDFNVAADSFEFAATGFTGLVAGANLAVTGQFVSNTTGTATAAMAQVVYENDAGLLYWDEDGSGSGVAVLIATLTNMASLTAADFLIV